MREKDAKQHLIDLAKTRITTAFIAALDEIERTFGYLWAHDEDRDRTDKEEEFFLLYKELRQNILDKGNQQRRLLVSDISGHEIKEMRYTLKMPIRNRSDYND